MGPSDTSRDDQLRLLLERSFRAAVAAADPGKVITGSLPPAPSGRLLVVGAGKAAAAMAAAVDGHYGSDVRLEGLVIAPDGPAAKPGRIETARASHPVPDQRGVDATARMLALVSGCGPDDHLLVLISGGGSALLCAPQGVTLAEKIELTNELLRSGADISEMNAVRKHLSKVKGGRLAAAASRTPVTALVLSDVVGDDLSTIASGPTAPDPSTYQDALAVLERYSIAAPAARAVLQQGARGERPETPKPGADSLGRVSTRLVGSNQRSLEAAASVLSRQGYPSHLLSNSITGEAREAAGVIAAVARQILAHRQPFEPPCALVSGGETTVTVRGSGRGGRNSEFALALALALPPGSPVAALAADSDGIDGSEDNAGAIVTPGLLERFDRRRARALLDSNDSYTFFAESEHLLATGPTGTNVNDLRVLLIDDSGAAGRGG